MRDIRFRFWNEQGKRFHYGPRQTFDLLFQQMTGLYDHEKDGCFIEQYTGLHDKNGRDIFEGDIVSVGTTNEDENGVPYWDELGKYKVKYYGADGYPAFDLAGHDYDMNGLAYIAQCGDVQMEVIGNIHENPGLLEGR